MTSKIRNGIYALVASIPLLLPGSAYSANPDANNTEGGHAIENI